MKVFDKEFKDKNLCSFTDPDGLIRFKTQITRRDDNENFLEAIQFLITFTSSSSPSSIKNNLNLLIFFIFKRKAETFLINISFQ